MRNCKICKKIFKSQRDFRCHYRIHTGEKPFKCDICDKRFAQKPNCQTHMRIHTGEKPFKCGICGRGFSVNSTLTQHRRIHSDEKPIQCDFCPETFRQHSHKFNHERKYHNRPKLKCEWNGCRSEFNCHAGLLYHIRTKHDPTPYHCDQCNRKYKLKRELDHHKRKHQIMKTQKLLAQK